MTHTFVTPIGVPGVSNKPIWSIILSTPAQDLDGMATQHAAGLVLVNSCSKRTDKKIIIIDSSYDNSVATCIYKEIAQKSDQESDIICLINIHDLVLYIYFVSIVFNIT